MCRKLPEDDRYDLGNQMRRASKSIPADIAEGFGRKTSEKEFKHHMKTAMASASDMETHLELAGRLGYAKRAQLETLRDGYSHVGTQLNRLIANWRHF
jgi:four helix bundle protein